jgi:hypothetical protein
MFWPAEAPRVTCSTCQSWQQLGTDGNGNVSSRGPACTCPKPAPLNGPLFKQVAHCVPEAKVRPCLDCGEPVRAHSRTKRCPTCAEAAQDRLRKRENEELRAWLAQHPAGTCVSCGKATMKPGSRAHKGLCYRNARRLARAASGRPDGRFAAVAA